MNTGRSRIIELSEMWERQQNSHIRYREDRIEIMLDIIGKLSGNDFSALDLACGTGSITRRILDRFPAAKVTSLDFDPVLLNIGRGALWEFSGRIKWLEKDLRKDDWVGEAGEARFDFALTTTAFHWLDTNSLKRTYRNIQKCLHKGGVLMNGDHMKSRYRNDEITEIMHGVTRSWSEKRFDSGEARNWDQWWDYISSLDEFSELIEERKKRYTEPDNHNQSVTLEDHVEFLREAGFSDVDVVWQYNNDRILVAMK